jgi:hypothetical protein
MRWLEARCFAKFLNYIAKRNFQYNQINNRNPKMRNHIISIINDQQFQSPITNLLEHNHKKIFPEYRRKKTLASPIFKLVLKMQFKKKYYKFSFLNHYFPLVVSERDFLHNFFFLPIYIMMEKWSWCLNKKVYYRDWYLIEDDSW